MVFRLVVYLEVVDFCLLEVYRPLVVVDFRFLEVYRCLAVSCLHQVSCCWYSSRTIAMMDLAVVPTRAWGCLVVYSEAGPVVVGRRVLGVGV